MGHFALIKREKCAKGPEKSPQRKDLKIGLSLFVHSLGVVISLPVFTSVKRNEKPFLTVNTRFPANWTPPSGPKSWKTTPREQSRKAVKAQLHLSPSKTNGSASAAGSSGPPNSPTSGSANTLPPRKSSLTCLLFMTARQRKLQEIRLGKLPAVALDSELTLASRTSTSSEGTRTDIEIEDPSCSTTYSRRSSVGRSHSA